MSDYAIHVCKHCSSVCSGVYCNSCKKAEDRRKMDEENKKLIPNFVCKVCELGWYSPMTKVFNSGFIEKIKEE